MIRRFVPVFFIFLCASVVHAQKYNPTVEPERATIEGAVREGYATYFDYPVKDIEKGWWKYCRSFGRPLNMKTYYKVTIPSHVNDGNVNLILLSRTRKSRSGSHFFLALEKEGIPHEKLNQYQQQIEGMVQDFKRQFYIDQLQDRLAKIEKKAAKTSKRVTKAKGKSKEKALIELEKYENNLAEVKGKIKEIYESFN